MSIWGYYTNVSWRECIWSLFLLPSLFLTLLITSAPLFPVFFVPLALDIFSCGYMLGSENTNGKQAHPLTELTMDVVLTALFVATWYLTKSNLSQGSLFCLTVERDTVFPVGKPLSWCSLGLSTYQEAEKGKVHTWLTDLSFSS